MQQSKVSVKYSEENSVFGRVSYYLLLEFLWEEVGWVGAYSRLGAYQLFLRLGWALTRGGR